MNTTKLILIALALCLCIAAPVAAVWSNGNWVSPNTLTGYRVIHDSTTGVDSKYKEVPNFEASQPLDKYEGTLRGTIRCAHNTFTSTLGIRNDIDGEKGAFRFYPILADGTFGDDNGQAGITLVPGNFTLFVPDGNGGQPEYSHAKIVAGQISYPETEIKGHAVSGYIAPVIPKVVCPTVSSFGWFSKPYIFTFTLQNTGDVATWSTIEYTITYSYQEQVPCDCIASASCVLPQVETYKKKCFERKDGTYTGTLALPRYSLAHSTEVHYALIPSGGLKNVNLTSVRVISCENAKCEQKQS